jgi:hypothetical protein
MEDSGQSLLVSALGVLGGLTTFAVAMAKRGAWVNKGKVSGGRWEIEAFQANIAALKEENERCWAERMRENAEHAEDCRAFEATIERRVKEAHTLRNQLHAAEGMVHVLQLELDMERRENGKPPWTMDENGEPK